MCSFENNRRYGPNFCEECGRKKEDAAECETVQKAMELEEVEKDCPYKSWEGDMRFIGLRKIWADAKLHPDTWQHRWNYGRKFTLRKKKDGEWPTTETPVDELISWPRQAFPPHPGHPYILASSAGQGYSEQFYVSRQMAKLVFSRLRKTRYVTKQMERRIQDRMKGKYGCHNGRNEARAMNHRFCLHSDGEFTPVDMSTLKPAFPVHCCVCGAFCGAGYIVDGYTQLEEDWGRTMGQFYFSAQDEQVYCESPLCQEVIKWVDTGDSSIEEGAKNLRVQKRRPSNETLMNYPKDARGALMVSRFLDFEARYRDKKYRLSEPTNEGRQL